MFLRCKVEGIRIQFLAFFEVVVRRYFSDKYISIYCSTFPVKCSPALRQD